MYNQGLFHDWLPKPLYVIFTVILLSVILSMSGIYSTNIAGMTSGTGFITEYFTFSMYCVTIGMYAVFPIIVPIKLHFKSKKILITSLLIMTLMCYLIGTCNNVIVMIVCCIILGAFKSFAMIECILVFMKIFNPSNHRGEFYSKFYPYSIILVQIVNLLAVTFTYIFEWYYIYQIAVVALLCCVLLCIVFMHNLHPMAPQPLGKIDFISISLYLIVLLSLNYVFGFAKQQGWSASPQIMWGIIIFVTSIFLFVWRQQVISVPYMDITAFRNKNLTFGIFFFFMLGVFLSTSNLQGAYTSTILGYDGVTNARLNIAMVPGIVLSGFIGFIFFRKGWWVKTYIFLGFSAFTLYVMFMYFLLQPVIEINQLLIPMFFKGFGMGAVYVGVSYYSLNRLSMPHLVTSFIAGGLVRSFLGTAVFGAVYSWALYYNQWNKVGALAVNMDSLSFLGQDRGGLKLYGTVQLQGILLSLKEIYGWLSILSVALLVMIIFFRFERRDLRAIIYMSNRKKMKPAKKYVADIEDATSVGI